MPTINNSILFSNFIALNSLSVDKDVPHEETPPNSKALHRNVFLELKYLTFVSVHKKGIFKFLSIVFNFTPNRNHGLTLPSFIFLNNNSHTYIFLLM